MGAVMDRAKQIDSRDESLEDAIGDFAGKQDLTGDDLPKAEPPKPRERVDCVILGLPSGSRRPARVAAARHRPSQAGWCSPGALRRSCQTTS